MMVADPFSYTFAGAPWFNVKWGYEIWLALWAEIFSVETWPIIQALVSCLLVAVLIRLIRLRLPQAEKVSMAVSIWITIAITLLAISYRLNSRPEMFSHLFTVMLLYLIRQEMTASSNRIYLIWLIQALWVNLHDGYGIGLVVIGIWTAATWFIDRVNQIPFNRRPWIILAGACAATCINPYGWEMLLRVPGIFMQVQKTKLTTEFLNMSDYRYWSIEAYLTVALTVIAFGGIVSQLFSKQVKSKKAAGMLRRIRTDQLNDLLVLLAFVMLATGAHRNLVFPALAAAPMVAESFYKLMAKLKSNRMMLIETITLPLLILLYGLVVSNIWYQTTGSLAKFGLALPHKHHPVYAANYLESEGLAKVVFADYRSSSYLLWRLYDKGFRTTIDLRDYEVFTPEWFDRYAEITHNPESFRQFDSQYRFNAVVLLSNQDQVLNRFLYNDSAWSLVHWDQTAVVYRKGHWDTESIHLSDTPQSRTGYGRYVNLLLNPFYETETASAYPELYAGFLLDMGDVAKAQAYIRQTVKPGVADALRGKSSLIRASSDTTMLSLDSAEFYFRRSLKAGGEGAATQFGLGMVLHTRGQYRAALQPLLRCIEADPDHLNAHLYLADCYEKLAGYGNAQSNYEKEIDHLNAAYRLNPDNPFIETDLGFIYYKLKNCDKALPYLHRIKNFSGLSQEDRDLARQYILRCGDQP